MLTHMHHERKASIRCLGYFLAAALFAVPLLAGPITFNFDHTLSGVAPAGPTPWLSATFSDAGAGAVNLTLSAQGLTGSEYVGQWYFNLNPALDPANLHFSETAASGTFTAPAVGAGADSFKPDYDGKYDIRLAFSVTGDNSAKFSGGDSVTFSITGIGNLTANDFLYLNTAVAGHESLYSAAYIQTVGEAVIIDSPPGAVPDGGSTAGLLGLAMMAVGGVGRRFARNPRS